ncbi:YiiX/YebB-like N1pC/P60 family cysteine hydrolase [Aestuariibaculum sp. M13]|uniref:YiiX/YebB-like N1pC/P60 family cysteine hydrolase n=1 Tax=Aestuariibaculum sp. M13 TaxID=2967132 RepID=UPI002159FCA3|nr:YiiX/YebB-like N1pC/P60 family cysteine hydrolase [Aestuariibaculum sp. M13]MCR8666235.1 YiiX/YebB-like N1pC/P60 family cysteine hydrolase [Aestuariibaculum sp. M13]
MSKYITPSSLKIGDVILHEGIGFISDFIKFLDNSNVSHSALYIGNEEVIEAKGSGITKYTLQESLQDARCAYIMRLKKRPDNFSPVIKRAKYYMDQNYAYDKMVFLVLLGLIRKSKIENYTLLFGKIIDNATVRAIEFLTKNTKTLVCSELVYRSYNEALKTPNHKFSLGLDVIAQRNKTPLETWDSTIYGDTDSSNIMSTPELTLKSKNELFDYYKTTLNSIYKTDFDTNDFRISNFEQDITSMEFKGYASLFNNFLTAQYYLSNPTTSEDTCITHVKAIDNLKRTAEVLVSPGDLFLRTKNLECIGKIKPY